MGNWGKLASAALIQKTVSSLKSNGIECFVVKDKDAARKKTLALLPRNAEVMTMSSVTVDTIGLPEEINESGKYDSVKAKLERMDRKTDRSQMQKLGAAPQYAVGSVHAVTEDGKLLIASNTGSQLPAYSYGASHVIWIAGTQKIVKNVEEGIRRIHEYVLPLESERIMKIYGIASNVSKLLIINKEIAPNRLTLIFVKEKLGF